MAKNQPTKLAAFEGHYDGSMPADLYLFGWVDQQNQKVYGPKIPGGLSYMVYFNFNEPIKGFNDFPKDEIPGAVNAVFQFYHLMVALGLFFIALTLFGIFKWWKGKLFQTKWLIMGFCFRSISASVSQPVWMVHR